MGLTLGPSLLPPAFENTSRQQRRAAARLSQLNPQQSRPEQPAPLRAVKVGEIHLHGLRSEVNTASLHHELQAALQTALQHQSANRRNASSWPRTGAVLPAGAGPGELARQIASELLARVSEESKEQP